jgi:phospholipase/lecithinase/hemolysin
MLSLEENQTILFIGDSITDCGRSRENLTELGNGYANMTAAMRREPAFWAYDGVHPTQTGHTLISDAWLEQAGI